MKYRVWLLVISVSYISPVVVHDIYCVHSCCPVASFLPFVKFYFLFVEWSNLNSHLFGVGGWGQFWEFEWLLSNSLSDVQITSTNIRWYCTVQNQIFNRFKETMAIAWHNNFWMNYRNLVDRLFYNQSKCFTHIMLHILPAFVLFRYVYKIHYQNSWIINNYETWACSTAVYCYLSFVLPCRLTKITGKNMQTYYMLPNRTYLLWW